MTESIGEQLRAALQQWEDDKPEVKPAEVPKPFQVSNNLNRATFKQVQDWPNTRKLVTKALLAQGYKVGSVSAVIGQMLRQNMIREEAGILRVNIREYTPLKNYKTLLNQKRKAQEKPKQVLVDVRRKKVVVTTGTGANLRQVSAMGSGIAAIPMQPKDPAPPALLPWSVREVLESLDVLQARAVYDELRKIFGDAK